jgi:hypothetical protein
MVQVTRIGVVQTTDLQEVVAALTAILGSDKCRSPEMLPDSSLGGFLREVDVVVDAADIDPSREGLISIEVRERGTEPWADEPRGKEDVGFVDEMHGKHLYLPTRELVLVAKSGFSANAMKKAEFLGIKTITPAQLTPGFVGEIVGNLDSVVEKNFALQVETVSPTLDPPDMHPDAMVDIDVQPLYRSDKTAIGTLGDLGRAYLKYFKPDRPAFAAPTGDEKEFTIEDANPHVEEGGAVYLMGPPPQETLHRIIHIVIKGKATVQVQEISLKHRDYDGTPSSSTKATPGDDVHHWVFTEGADGLKGGVRVLRG